MADNAVQVKGTYQNISQENLEEYCSALGIPYLARKMIVANRPILHIEENDNGTWTICISSFIHKMEISFKLGKEYEEVCLDNNRTPMKSVTTLKKQNVLETISFEFYDVTLIKTYEFTENGCVLTMTHKESGATAKRYFKRVKDGNMKYCCNNGTIER